MPTQYGMSDFATYAINFWMIISHQNQQVQEHKNLYALLLYSGFDPQATGSVDSNSVVNQMIGYYSQMYPGVNQQVVNQVLAQNGVQPCGRISEQQFIRIYNAVE